MNTEKIMDNLTELAQGGAMPEEKIHQRELYDRRSGLDRRKESNPCKKKTCQKGKTLFFL
jgi:hypothetical protein